MPTGSTAWATHSGALREDVFISGTVLPEDSPSTWVKIVNIGEDEMRLCRNTVVAEAEPVQVLTTKDNPAPPAFIAEMVDRIDPSVPKDIADQLQELLQKYAQAFSTSELDLGWTDKVTHTIDTGNNPPARQVLRKVPIAQRHMSPSV